MKLQVEKYYSFFYGSEMYALKVNGVTDSIYRSFECAMKKINEIKHEKYSKSEVIFEETI